MEYGQSLNDKKNTFEIIINYAGNSIPLKLEFDPYQSIMIKISRDEKAEFIDVGFTPKTPVYIQREKTGKERWEVEKK